MRKVSDAVVLMAGSGSRLRASGETLPKPLIQIAGRPLASYLIESLGAVGVRDLHVVVGENGDALGASLREFVPESMRLHPIQNPDWQKQNGLSVLCAEGKVRAPFFLLMGDHLFDPAILELLAREADSAQLNLAVDRKLETIFDLRDAMKLQTRDDHVVAIGKDLETYDAIDTGIFLCPNELFACLRRARGQKNGDCSLADAVQLMADDGRVYTIDIEAAWWQDIDTDVMRSQAEEVIARRTAALVPTRSNP
jgi:choline kinase